MVIMLPAKALHDAFGLNAMVCTSFQAAGGAGQKGIDELTGQVAAVGEDVDQLINDGAAAARKVEHSVHANTLAFNVVPLLGTLDDQGYTDEEMKMLNESRKILSIPDLERDADLRPRAGRRRPLGRGPRDVRPGGRPRPGARGAQRVPEPRRRRRADAAGVGGPQRDRRRPRAHATSTTRACSTSSSSATTCSRAPR